ncbi:hypothetical protein I2486_11265 [Cellulophaga sp. E16_2]|nr:MULTISPECIES: hypothetical protein [unclassified Cellulophaga]MBO0591985.1 hypothetical protein [Cellulophaga sp. E16_2]
MKYILIVFVFWVSGQVQAQNELQNRKFRAPLWTTHDTDVDIAGVSFGFVPRDLTNDTSLVRTYGVRVEAFPLSFFYFMAPKSPLSTYNEEYYKTLKGNASQQINGLNIATGSFEEIDVNGISTTLFLHYSRKHNGVAVAGVTNTIERGNGLMIAYGGNDVYHGNGIMVGTLFGNSTNSFNGLQISAANFISEKGTGLQIGIFNSATNFRGLQLGLWNKNSKRSLPFINWQFKT